MKTFIFTVRLQGSGSNIQEAWEDATLSFALEPGEYEEYELIEEE